MISASCLCGGVRFHLPEPQGPIVACHCTQCRKLSGHYSASFDADEAAVVWDAVETQGEYRTPGGGIRGFCLRCGSSLWFRDRHGNFSVEAGAVDEPFDARLTEHIFVADKGDYYAIGGNLPHHEGWGE